MDADGKSGTALTEGGEGKGTAAAETRAAKEGAPYTTNKGAGTRARKISGGALPAIISPATGTEDSRGWEKPLPVWYGGCGTAPSAYPTASTAAYLTPRAAATCNVAHAATVMSREAAASPS